MGEASGTRAMIESVLRREWVLAPPVSLEPMTEGMNNQSFLVTSGGTQIVLKRYQNTDRNKRRLFEHRLLGVLNGASLPFSVPVSVPNRAGMFSVEVTVDGEEYRLALFRHIPGQAARAGEPPAAHACGAALATLDRTLAGVRLDTGYPVPATYGALAHVHGSVPSAQEAIHSLLGYRADASRIVNVLEMAEAGWRLAVEGWDRQLIHGDYYPSNVLMVDGDVAGILDFESAGLGYRAMDFAIGLGAFGTRDWRQGCSWPDLEAFATGYLQQLPLSRDELMATPVLLLLREATSFVHWLGRFAEGLTTLDDVHNRAARLLSLSAWLDTHQVELVDRLCRLRGS
jgi:Ser/Thr protein kinase RdoA (MazF antagonist)